MRNFNQEFDRDGMNNQLLRVQTSEESYIQRQNEVFQPPASSINILPAPLISPAVITVTASTATTTSINTTMANYARGYVTVTMAGQSNNKHDNMRMTNSTEQRFLLPNVVRIRGFKFESTQIVRSDQQQQFPLITRNSTNLTRQNEHHQIHEYYLKN